MKFKQPTPKRCKNACLAVLHYISVEPMWMLGLMAIIVRSLVFSAGLYRAVCWRQQGDSLWIDCNNQKTWTEEEESKIQKEAAEWDMAVTLAYLLPSTFVNLVLGTWSDLIGRQLNMVIAVTGLTINGLGLLLVFSDTIRAPVIVLVLFALFSGITGYMGSMGAACFAYLSDITPDGRFRSIRMAVFNVAGSLSSAIGAMIVSILFARSSYSLECLLILFCGFFAIIYAILNVKQIPPGLLKAYHNGNEHEFEPIQNAGCGNGALELPVRAFKMVIAAFKAYFKKRQGHRRMILICLAVILFIFVSSSSEPVQQYTFLDKPRGLGWTQKELAQWTSASKIGALLIGGTCMVVMKLLHVRDTVITIIALTSLAAKWAIIGLSKETWQMYVAAAVGSFQEMAVAGLISFMSQLVEPDEIGKVFTIVGLTFETSAILSKVIFNAIYIATLDFMPGFMFFVAAGLMVICIVMMVWIHFIAKREKVGF